MTRKFRKHDRYFEHSSVAATEIAFRFFDGFYSNGHLDKILMDEYLDRHRFQVARRALFHHTIPNDFYIGLTIDEPVGIQYSHPTREIGLEVNNQILYFRVGGSAVSINFGKIVFSVDLAKSKTTGNYLDLILWHGFSTNLLTAEVSEYYFNFPDLK